MANIYSIPTRAPGTAFDDLRRLAGMIVIFGAFAFVMAVVAGLI